MLRTRISKSARSGLALLAVATIGLAACGSDGKSSESTASNTTAAPTTASATTAAAGGGATTTAESAGSTAASSAPASTPSSGRDLAALEAAAKDEGGLSLYSDLSQAKIDELVKLFNKSYPDIKVDNFRAADTELETRAQTELDSGKGIADHIVLIDQSWMDRQGAAGNILPIEGPMLDGANGFDAAQYVHGENDDYFSLGGTFISLGWNTDQVKEPMTDFPDLLRPELGDGKIGVIDPAAGPTVVDYYKWLEKTYGADFITKLAAQKPRIYTTSAQMAAALTSGEIIAENWGSAELIGKAKDDGAPVDFAIPPGGVWGSNFYGATLETAPHPAASQLFSNFLVTPEAQAIIGASSAAVLPNVPGALLTLDQLTTPDPANTTPDAVAAYVAEWNKQFR